MLRRPSPGRATPDRAPPPDRRPATQPRPGDRYGADTLAANAEQPARPSAPDALRQAPREGVLRTSPRLARRSRRAQAAAANRVVAGTATRDRHRHESLHAPSSVPPRRCAPHRATLWCGAVTEQLPTRSCRNTNSWAPSTPDRCTVTAPRPRRRPPSPSTRPSRSSPSLPATSAFTAAPRAPGCETFAFKLAPASGTTLLPLDQLQGSLSPPLRIAPVTQRANESHVARLSLLDAVHFVHREGVRADAHASGRSAAGGPVNASAPLQFSPLETPFPATPPRADAG